MKILQQELIYPYSPDTRPTDSCHASTLVSLDNGDILAAWFGGTGESHGDVEIWSSARSVSGIWSKPEILSGPTDIACWNPVLYAHGSDVTLFFKRGIKIFSWQTFVRRSHDGGMTWEPERELVHDDIGGRGPVKNKPVLLSDGTLLAPASHESRDASRWDAFFDRSCDGGHTWTRTEYIKTDPYVKLIQPTVWESTAGRVHALFRSAAGFICRADSDDYGRSWTPAYPTSMPNNNSGIDLVKMPGGTLALVCNPVGQNWGARSPLTLYFSDDNGQSWKDAVNLAEGEGEYSYPAIIYAGGALHITFTYQRKSIMYCKVG